MKVELTDEEREELISLLEYDLPCHIDEETKERLQSIIDKLKGEQK